MLNKEQHEGVIAAIEQIGVPRRAKTTLFGNYKHDTVVQLLVEAVDAYRKQEIAFRKQEIEKIKGDSE